jgi:hypothetical protein
MNKRNDFAYIRTLIKARGVEMPSQSIDPKDALLDIRTLARVAIESDPAVIKRDLQMIPTIVDTA